MYSLEIPELHEIRRLELIYRLLFFLRDLGIESAREPAVIVWTEYMHVVGALMINDFSDSQ